MSARAGQERSEDLYTRVGQCLGKVRSKCDDGEVFVGARTGIYALEAETACERYKEGCRGLQRDGMAG